MKGKFVLLNEVGYNILQIYILDDSFFFISWVKFDTCLVETIPPEVSG
jgi:hypothetical protein